MKYVKLEEVLTPEGMCLVTRFADAVIDGAHQGAHYLDVHAVLREKIRPHVKDPGEVDVDYLTLVVLAALRKKGVPVPGLPPGIL